LTSKIPEDENLEYIDDKGVISETEECRYYNNRNLL